MKSPFPGMDPYLEAHWGDVHTRLIVYTGDQLRPQLPGDLKVRVEERISVQDPDSTERPVGYIPDVRILAKRPEGSLSPSSAASATLVLDAADPVLVPRMVEPATERTLQILDTRSGNRIVTTIEILSPGNKLDAKGRVAFRKKQWQLAESGVNLVEIDLLRDGEYVLIAPWEAVPASCRGTYRVAVSRATDPDNIEMYRVPLRERLPTIRIPLRAGDCDVLLNLQALIEAAYENGGYDDIDYGGEPEPPLWKEDADWANELLRAAQRR
ncbi:MAG: DUF4058 family protein [Planctomycetota bacterium]|nr:DUF4058 family protein [Planctomycetota bacterium]